MKKFLISLFFVAVLFILNSAVALAGGVVKPYLVIPQDWKDRTAADIPRLKQNILTGLEASSKFYQEKAGKTFSYDRNVEVIYAEGSIRDNYGSRNCIIGHFERGGLIAPDPDLKIPRDILHPPFGIVDILFVVGTGELYNCAYSNPLGVPRGTAFINHNTIEALGSADAAVVSQVSHELGHTFGLSEQGWAKGHPCSVLSSDQCKDEFRSKTLPPGSECLGSVMGGAGGYCRDGNDKMLLPDFNQIGFDNSEFNPELQTLSKAAFLDPGFNPSPIVTPPPLTPSPIQTPSPISTPTPSPILTPSPGSNPGTCVNPKAPPGKVPKLDSTECYVHQGCIARGGDFCELPDTAGDEASFTCQGRGGTSLGKGPTAGCLGEHLFCCKFVTSCESLNGECLTEYTTGRDQYGNPVFRDRLQGYCPTDFYNYSRSGDQKQYCYTKLGSTGETPAPLPTTAPTPPVVTPSPSTPTPNPSYSVIQINVSNYENFGPNSPGDEGSSTQTFTSSSTQITWKKSTLNPGGPIYISPQAADGTSKEILVVSLANRQIYQVPNSPFVITAKVIRKIVRISVNDGQSVKEISSDLTQTLSIHLPGTAGTIGSYPIIFSISYNDGSSKSVSFKFNYSPAGSASPTTSTPTTVISTDEAVCNAKGGVCQASCAGTAFSAQVGTCPSKNQLCCATPVTSPSTSKCSGTGPVSSGFGGPCSPNDKDIVQPASGGTACTVASCYFNPDIKEYCWYNSGATYADYQGCYRNGQGVTITTPQPTAINPATASSAPVAPASCDTSSKSGPGWQWNYVCGCVSTDNGKSEPGHNAICSVNPQQDTHCYSNVSNPVAECPVQ